MDGELCTTLTLSLIYRMKECLLRSNQRIFLVWLVLQMWWTSLWLCKRLWASPHAACGVYFHFTVWVAHEATHKLHVHTLMRWSQRTRQRKCSKLIACSYVSDMRPSLTALQRLEDELENRIIHNQALKHMKESQMKSYRSRTNRMRRTWYLF